MKHEVCDIGSRLPSAPTFESEISVDHTAQRVDRLAVIVVISILEG